MLPRTYAEFPYLSRKPVLGRYWNLPPYVLAPHDKSPVSDHPKREPTKLIGLPNAFAAGSPPERPSSDGGIQHCPGEEGAFQGFGPRLVPAGTERRPHAPHGLTVIFRQFILTRR